MKRSVKQQRGLLTQHIQFPGLFETVHSEITIICNVPKGIDM